MCAYVVSVIWHLLVHIFGAVLLNVAGIDLRKTDAKWADILIRVSILIRFFTTNTNQVSQNLKHIYNWSITFIK